MAKMRVKYKGEWIEVSSGGGSGDTLVEKLDTLPESIKDHNIVYVPGSVKKLTQPAYYKKGYELTLHDTRDEKFLTEFEDDTRKELAKTTLNNVEYSFVAKRSEDKTLIEYYIAKSDDLNTSLLDKNYNTWSSGLVLARLDSIKVDTDKEVSFKNETFTFGDEKPYEVEERNTSKLYLVDTDRFIEVGGGFAGSSGKDSYRLNTQISDYKTDLNDYDGRTLILGSKTEDQAITISMPPENFIGQSLTVRKSSPSDRAQTLTLIPDTNVRFTPPDGNVLRRQGSTVVLVYTGNGNFELIGELA